MTDWYYEADGRSNGPVDQDRLAQMLAEGRLSRHALVWTAAFGSDWREASSTDAFGPLMSTPPALPSRSAPPPLSGAASPLAFSQLDTSGNVDRLAYVMALTPLLIFVLDALALSLGKNPSAGPTSFGVGFWHFVATLFLAVMDAKRLNAAGLNPQHRRLVPFILLTPFAYLWRRAAVAKRPYSPLWVWFGAVVVLIILEAAFMA